MNHTLRNMSYFLLTRFLFNFENHCSRYSVKVIAKKRMVETAFTDYDHSWDLETVIKHKKEPLLLIVTGVMDQQPIVAGYLGRVIEEKFHIAPHSISVLPCIPLVRDGLKDMVHPEIGPINFSEGVKEGYSVVNLSLNQDFNLGPEFADANRNDELGDYCFFTHLLARPLINLCHIQYLRCTRKRNCRRTSSSCG